MLLITNFTLLNCLTAGQNVVRAAGLPQQLLQFPIQQTIPVQIPIATSNGQTIIQTVHIPIQTVATAMPNTGGLIQAGGQLQIIQPQLTQVTRVLTVNYTGLSYYAEIIQVYVYFVATATAISPSDNPVWTNSISADTTCTSS